MKQPDPPATDSIRDRRAAFFRGFAKVRGVRSPLWKKIDKRLALDAGCSPEFMRHVRTGRDHLGDERIAELRAFLNDGHEAALDPSCLLRPAASPEGGGGSEKRRSGAAKPVPTAARTRPRAAAKAKAAPEIKILGSVPVPGGTLCTILLPAGTSLQRVERLQDAFVLVTEQEGR